MTTPLPTSQVQIPEGLIDLGVGDPSFALLPIDLLQRAAESLFARRDPACLQYGAEQGDGYFRRALAGFLGKGCGFSVDPGRLFVTCGISNGLDLICTLFTRPGEVIFVEEPSYFLALRIFADHGLRAIPIQTDENGLVIESLEEKLAEFQPKFLYIIPTFQNPGGRMLSQARREKLVELSQARDFLILADEVYQFLNYTCPPPTPFGAYTDTQNVIALSSFSKILAPGLRLGWIQAHPERIKRLAGCGLLDSGGGLNPFTSAVVRNLLETGDLERNIAHLKDVYGARLRVMGAALRRHLPEATFVTPQGGYFFWVRLPGGMDAQELQEKAGAYRVGFRPGIRFSSQGGLRDYIRLGFSFYDAEEIEQGLMRLGQCVNG